jgi:hypothetical protein
MKRRNVTSVAGFNTKSASFVVGLDQARVAFVVLQIFQNEKKMQPQSGSVFSESLTTHIRDQKG